MEAAYLPEPLPEMAFDTSDDVAAERTSEVVQLPVNDLDNLLDRLPKEEYAGMSREQLMAVRDDILTFVHAKSHQIVELQQDHDVALRELIWINGFIRDRQ